MKVTVTLSCENSAGYRLHGIQGLPDAQYIMARWDIGPFLGARNMDFHDASRAVREFLRDYVHDPSDIKVVNLEGI